MANEKLDTSQKAQQVNLDANRYGTFAEIGAGQEVVGWFFRAGGAAGSDLAARPSAGPPSPLASVRHPLRCALAMVPAAA